MPIELKRHENWTYHFIFNFSSQDIIHTKQQSCVTFFYINIIHDKVRRPFGCLGCINTQPHTFNMMLPVQKHGECNALFCLTPKTFSITIKGGKGACLKA